MSRLSDLAFAHQNRRIRLGHDLAKRAVRVWRSVPVADLDGGWQKVAPALVRLVSEAQVAAAQQSAPYLDRVDAAYGRNSNVQIVPDAFAGVMGDGREVAPALFGAVTRTKDLIGRGVEPLRALESGAAFLGFISKAALHDMARNADRVLSAGRGYTRYVRVVNGAACSRCAILAGIYSGPEAFRRHVGCQCGVAALLPDAKAPKGLMDSPQAYFDSLTRAEQDRVFTRDGAEAIRQGASPVSVVNARRGAYGIGYSGHGGATGAANRLQRLTIGVRADGTPLQVFATTEGTTARGQFYRSDRATRVRDGRYTRTRTTRLMPEQIAMMAGNDPDRWVELLYKYGYLDPSGSLARSFNAL